MQISVRNYCAEYFFMVARSYNSNRNCSRSIPRQAVFLPPLPSSTVKTAQYLSLMQLFDIGKYFTDMYRNPRSYALRFFLIFLSGTLWWRCAENSQETQTSPQAETVVAATQVPSFNADSAYAFVARQVAFGPRVPNSAAHTACGDYLIGKLKSYGLTVEMQAFDATAYDGKVLHLRNIIASYRPEARKRIMLAAHWDTRPMADRDTANTQQPIAGANDGGSGVGVLLEIARQLQQADSLNVGVDLFFFDGEDYGEPQDHQTSESQQQIWWCLGSQHWSKNKHQRNYIAYYGVLLDMVGAEGATFYQEEVSRRNAGVVNKKIWDAAHALGHGQYFVYRDSPEVLDDHVFVNYDAGIPMIDVIEYAPGNEGYFADYHHTHADDMDIISRETLRAVGQTVLYAIYQE